MRVFALKTCDKCRRAIAELRACGLDVQVTDVRADGITTADLAQFLEQFGADLANRRSTTWRNLTPQQRQEDPARLLARYPTLMKRPLIDADGRLFLGWGADVRRVLLG
jgi:arsenate reductase-like glutaredoxin family protein